MTNNKFIIHYLYMSNLANMVLSYNTIINKKSSGKNKSINNKNDNKNDNSNNKSKKSKEKYVGLEMKLKSDMNSDSNIIKSYNDFINLSTTKLYKSIKPFKTYKLKVSDLHTIAYYTYGNKYGKPVLYVHGGPGAGTSNNSSRFFNPAKYYIILVDQRGSGKSTPSGELRENTTWDLISDFEKVRENLGIDEWMVFGGSWGSTLSLVYAINYPNRVTEIIIRGVFLGTKKEIDWVTEGEGLQIFNPYGWDMYSSTIPDENKENTYMKSYEKCFKGDFGDKLKDDCLLSWSVWESMNSNLKQESINTILKDLKKNKKYIALSKIEHHYFSNLCFLKKGYLTNKSNLDKIKDKPIIIVQGMYDLVCPYENAYKLHKLLPNSKLYPTISGHSQFEPENIKYLVKATNSFI
jgi:proline iminopeptidase